METFLLKNKPLFQSTLGDLVEVLKEELGFASESGNDEKGNTFPSGSKHYVVIDVERALDILRVSNKKWGRK